MEGICLWLHAKQCVQVDRVRNVHLCEAKFCAILPLKKRSDATTAPQPELQKIQGDSVSAKRPEDASVCFGRIDYKGSQCILWGVLRSTDLVF